MVIQALRDSIPKWVLAIILGLFTVPFALWGINSYFTAASDNSAAVVNGDEITPGDYQRAYQNQYSRLQQMYGANFRPELVDEKQLHQQVLDQLIISTLLKAQVKQQHYAVSDQDLLDNISKTKAFQVDGQFSKQVYLSTLAANSLAPATYEQSVRESLVMQQLQDEIRNTAVALPAELAAAIALRDQQREITYLTISSKRYLSQAHISDAQVESYYKAHSADFMTDEKVTLAYVELSQAELASMQAKPTDAELQALYKQQLASFQQAESRHAAHILIASNGTDPKADAAAKAKAEDVYKQLQAGADFAGLAAKYSEDPGSAKSGGDLGEVTRGAMVKPFEDALFAMQKPGDMTPPVHTQFGYHIIKLLSVKAGEAKPFAAVRDQLLADYTKKQADDQYYALGEKLADLAYEHPNSLDEVSRQLKLPIRTVENVTRQIAGKTTEADVKSDLSGNPAVRKAAFSDAVLNQGNNSEPIQLGPNHAVVVRVKGHVPSVVKPLNEVRAQIVNLLQQQYAQQQASKQAADLMQALQKGGDPASLAKSSGAMLVPAKFQSRAAKDVPPAVLKAAFDSPAPAAGTHQVQMVTADNGDPLVVMVTAVKPGNASGINEEQRIATQRGLASFYGNQEFAAYVINLRRQAKIKINQANIEQQDD